MDLLRLTTTGGTFKTMGSFPTIVVDEGFDDWKSPFLPGCKGPQEPYGSKDLLYGNRGL